MGVELVGAKGAEIVAKIFLPPGRGFGPGDTPLGAHDLHLLEESVGYAEASHLFAEEKSLAMQLGDELDQPLSVEAVRLIWESSDEQLAVQDLVVAATSDGTTCAASAATAAG